MRYCWPLHATVCPCMRLMERALCGYVWRQYHLLTATIYAQSFHSQPVTVCCQEHANAICLLYSQCAGSLSDFFLDAWSRPTRATNAVGVYCTERYVCLYAEKQKNVHLKTATSLPCSFVRLTMIRSVHFGVDLLAL